MAPNHMQQRISSSGLNNNYVICSSLTAVITNDCFRVWNGHLKLQAELFIPPEALRLIARAGSMFRKKHIQFATLKTLKLFNR
ncbi:hypothetical protein RRG08_050409 [Elysia crispata]|uniref:Uncharacterized protein n=1 Tax=Elysia crispata TaxID=231223 RepID=A0AAE1DJ67_9GAST|nr:hypothetical protein RRG08_050409 [Elysia crispata]